VALVVLSTGTVGVTLLAGVSFGSDLTLAAAAALGAAFTMGLVLFAAQRVESTMTLLILGLMLGYLTSAIVSLLIFFSISERIQAYINWTFGSFGSVTWSQMKILAPAVVVGLLVALTTVKSLNALLLGEGYARSMGMRVNRTRTSLVISASLLAGTVTAFCGPIGFIGIAVPHLCRSLFNTSDHRFLLPASMLVGAMVALLAAVIAEVPGHSMILPLNAITSVIGAPVVIWVVLRYRNAKAAFGS
jgi:iron complex transport system permease protein